MEAPNPQFWTEFSRITREKLVGHGGVTHTMVGGDDLDKQFQIYWRWTEALSPKPDRQENPPVARAFPLGPGLEIYHLLPGHQSGGRFVYDVHKRIDPIALDHLLEEAHRLDLRFVLLRDFSDWLRHFEIGDFTSRGFIAGSQSNWYANRNSMLWVNPLPACSLSEASPKPLITAHCCTDDAAKNITFDAAPWFAQATPGEIKLLIDWGWKDEGTSMAVFFAKTALKPLYDYLNTKPVHSDDTPVSYEIRVNSEDAIDWLLDKPQYQFGETRMAHINKTHFPADDFRYLRQLGQLPSSPFDVELMGSGVLMAISRAPGLEADWEDTFEELADDLTQSTLNLIRAAAEQGYDWLMIHETSSILNNFPKFS